MSATRSHDDLQLLLGAYALDAVDGDEYEAVELHLRSCPKCRAEVAEHREVAALIAHGGAPAPEGVWNRIASSLEPPAPRMRLDLSPSGASIAPAGADDLSDRPASSDGADVVPIGRARSKRWTSGPVLAVAGMAAVIIFALGAVIVRLDNRVGTVEGEMAAVELHDVASNAWVDPEARKAELASPDKSLEVPVAVTADGSGFVLAGATEKLPADRTYQLWGVVGDETISLGTFQGGDDVVPFRVDPSVKAIAVTEEKAGGVAVSKNDAVLVTEI